MTMSAGRSAPFPGHILAANEDASTADSYRSEATRTHLNFGSGVWYSPIFPAGGWSYERGVGECSYSDEQEQAIRATRRIYRSLTNLDESDFDFGSRAFYVGEIIDEELGNPSAALEGSAAVLRARNPMVADAAKAALIRVLAGKPEIESRSEFVSLCIASLCSQDELQAIAAARTLGEIADAPAMSQIRQAAKHVPGERVRGMIMEIVKRLEAADAVDARTSKGA